MPLPSDRPDCFYSPHACAAGNGNIADRGQRNASRQLRCDCYAAIEDADNLNYSDIAAALNLANASSVSRLLSGETAMTAGSVEGIVRATGSPRALRGLLADIGFDARPISAVMVTEANIYRHLADLTEARGDIAGAINRGMNDGRLDRGERMDIAARCRREAERLLEIAAGLEGQGGNINGNNGN